jgi:hypothetical protein
LAVAGAAPYSGAARERAIGKLDWLLSEPEHVRDTLQEPGLDPDERREILEADSILARIADAALISRELGIPVRPPGLPETLDDWPLDDRLAATALARHWRKVRGR